MLFFLKKGLQKEKSVLILIQEELKQRRDNMKILNAHRYKNGDNLSFFKIN